jgi:peptidoglycan/xylan/chitin deacetylase (PgdA/CDA1 family)
MYFQLAVIAVLALKVSAQANNGPQPAGVYAPQKSPVFPSTLVVAAGAPKALTVGTPTAGTLTQSATLTGYPPAWTIPPTNSAEVVAAIAAVDWTKVPNIAPKKFDANSNPIVTGYAATDPDCWWSDTNCDVPKQTYLPPDIWYCPRPGDWGLTYDDGPFNQGISAADNPYAEPALYNFLAAHGNQKSTLFYIGSDVFGFPQAAQRALSDGHVICVHTWSHHPSTSLTNNQLVAEFYWTLKVIKEATGITPKCWRPPYGDADDRVRAIAWQMGMTTIIWDEDTNDWNMPGTGGGVLPAATVDGYFQGWITARTSGKDNVKGHIVLEHELNNSTVIMTEKWLPTLQKTFNVVTVQQCMNISQPYWEPQWVYPTEANPSTTIVKSSTSAPALASTSASALPSANANAGNSGSGSAPSATASAAGHASSAGRLIVGAGALLLPVLGVMMLL